MNAATNVEIKCIGGDLINPTDNIIAIMVTFNNSLFVKDNGWVTFREDSIKICGWLVEEPHKSLKMFSPEDAHTIIEALGSTDVGKKIIDNNNLTETDLIVEQ